MSVLRKNCGLSRRDRRRNVDMMTELSIEKDIVNVLECRRLLYVGRVTRMNNDRFTHILLYGYIDGSRTKADQLGSAREDCAARNMSIHQATELIQH